MIYKKTIKILNPWGSVTLLSPPPKWRCWLSTSSSTSVHFVCSVPA